MPGIDGQKMSKSYGNDLCIFESEKKLRKRVMSIVTDSQGVDEPKEPEGNTIFELYKLVATDDKVDAMADKLRSSGIGYGYGHAKQELFETILEYFADARSRRLQLEENPDEVEQILRSGADRIRPVVEKTMEAVRSAIGVIPSHS